MSRTRLTARRTFIVGVAVLVMAPLVGAMHDHGVDHSGAVLHMEADHGGHEHAPPDLVDRQISQGISPPALSGATWTLPKTSTSNERTMWAESVDHPARPPPPSFRSRAPPKSL